MPILFNFDRLEDFVLFLLENNLCTCYKKSVDISYHIYLMQKNNEFLRLIKKMNKSYLKKNLYYFSSMKMPFDYNCIYQLSESLSYEIERIYFSYGVVVDTLLLLEAEKYNDIYDLYLILKNIYSFGISNYEIEKKFDISPDEFKKMSNDDIYEKFSAIAKDLYFEDKFYFFRPYKFSDEFLNSTKLIDIFYKVVVD